jgi:holliday junction DNA helicase RuvA
MIAALHGTLVEKEMGRTVVDVGGVGYEVLVSLQTAADLPELGAEVRLLCHTHVREDALQIFGFLAPDERRAFELLIGVSGIGPKLALTILSGMPVAELAAAVSGADHARLQTIPGVGRKTAERVVVELREKFARLDLAARGPSARPAAPAGQAASVIEALVGLGYKRPLSEKAVRRALELGPPELASSAERLLRAALAAVGEG